MVNLMLFTFSESALTNFGVWCGLGAISFSIILFLFEKMVLPKDTNVPGKAYGYIWLLSGIVFLSSVIFAGHGSREDMNKINYPKVDKVQVTAPAEVRERGDAIEKERVDR